MGEKGAFKERWGSTHGLQTHGGEKGACKVGCNVWGATYGGEKSPRLARRDIAHTPWERRGKAKAHLTFLPRGGRVLAALPSWGARQMATHRLREVRGASTSSLCGRLTFWCWSALVFDLLRSGRGYPQISSMIK